ncbi:transport-associated protein [Psychromonas ingrahamii 37]|uniref:Transport-associated protein n=1 Tax=Psychromonas ingrahamii (strain DSM 17664 / CCUG 51855 / 37) TaxID=357804 RepID=A1SU45_PSYIN|nr:BON domain-containing protein [Psychromonas ingrahamii]ABM03010.1 transport-associated protein [Psychromonas ingrahamii 37]
MQKIFLSIFLGTLLLLQGCAGGLIVMAGTAVAVSSDERSISEQLSDDSLSMDALYKINELNINKEDIRINLISNSGYLLIIGQVTSQQWSEKIEKQLNTLPNVKGIYNQLRIGQPIGFAQQSIDSWITTKVKGKLTANDNVNPLKIKVATENSEVFLIGKVTKEMADQATGITRQVNGVKRVNRVFQLK